MVRHDNSVTYDYTLLRREAPLKINDAISIYVAMEDTGQPLFLGLNWHQLLSGRNYSVIRSISVDPNRLPCKFSVFWFTSYWDTPASIVYTCNLSLSQTLKRPSIVIYHFSVVAEYNQERNEGMFL